MSVEAFISSDIASRLLSCMLSDGFILQTASVDTRAMCNFQQKRTRVFLPVTLSTGSYLVCWIMIQFWKPWCVWVGELEIVIDMWFLNLWWRDECRGAYFQWHCQQTSILYVVWWFYTANCIGWYLCHVQFSTKKNKSVSSSDIASRLLSCMLNNDSVLETTGVFELANWKL